MTKVLHLICCNLSPHVLSLILVLCVQGLNWVKKKNCWRTFRSASLCVCVGIPHTRLWKCSQSSDSFIDFHKNVVSHWNLTIFFSRIFLAFFSVVFGDFQLLFIRFRMSSTTNSEVNVKLEKAIFWDRDHSQGCLSLRSCVSLLVLLRTVDVLNPRLDRPNHEAVEERRDAARNLLLSSASHSSSLGSRSGTQTSRPAARKTWTSWDGFLSVPSSCIVWPCKYTWGHLVCTLKRADVSRMSMWTLHKWVSPCESGGKSKNALREKSLWFTYRAICSGRLCWC